MKDILITGAYGGMGKAAVTALSRHGFRVFALDLKVGESGENIIPVKADITSEESVSAAFAAVKQYTDSLHAVIHFAGIYMLDSLVEIDSAGFRRIFDVNLYGAYLVNRVFMPMLKEGSRIIITTSELAPLYPLPFTGIYAVSKTALDRYAYSLRMELQLLGIQVSVLRAGAVDTGMLGVSTDALEKFCNKTSLYTCNADRFAKIVNSVEARNIPPEKIAEKVIHILTRKRPSFAYSINRNPLLILLGILPSGIQTAVIRRLLK